MRGAAVGMDGPRLCPPRAMAPRGLRFRQRPRCWEQSGAAEGDAVGWISRLLKEKGRFSVVFREQSPALSPMPACDLISALIYALSHKVQSHSAGCSMAWCNPVPLPAPHLKFIGDGAFLEASGCQCHGVLCVRAAAERSWGAVGHGRRDASSSCIPAGRGRGRVVLRHTVVGYGAGRLSL